MKLSSIALFSMHGAPPTSPTPTWEPFQPSTARNSTLTKGCQKPFELEFLINTLIVRPQNGTKTHPRKDLRMELVAEHEILMHDEHCSLSNIPLRQRRGPHLRKRKTPPENENAPPTREGDSILSWGVMLFEQIGAGCHLAPVAEYSNKICRFSRSQGFASWIAALQLSLFG